MHLQEALPEIMKKILDIAGITVNKIAHTVTIDGKEIGFSVLKNSNFLHILWRTEAHKHFQGKKSSIMYGIMIITKAMQEQ